jgi:hypothetical protein
VRCGSSEIGGRHRAKHGSGIRVVGARNYRCRDGDLKGRDGKIPSSTGGGMPLHYVGHFMPKYRGRSSSLSSKITSCGPTNTVFTPDSRGTPAFNPIGASSNPISDLPEAWATLEPTRERRRIRGRGTARPRVSAAEASPDQTGRSSHAATLARVVPTAKPIRTTQRCHRRCIEGGSNLDRRRQHIPILRQPQSIVCLLQIGYQRIFSNCWDALPCPVLFGCAASGSDARLEQPTINPHSATTSAPCLIELAFPQHRFQQRPAHQEVELVLVELRRTRSAS